MPVETPSQSTGSGRRFVAIATVVTFTTKGTKDHEGEDKASCSLACLLVKHISKAEP
jgi:hypothetical protein